MSRQVISNMKSQADCRALQHKTVVFLVHWLEPLMSPCCYMSLLWNPKTGRCESASAPPQSAILKRQLKIKVCTKKDWYLTVEKLHRHLSLPWSTGMQIHTQHTNRQTNTPRWENWGDCFKVHSTWHCGLKWQNIELCCYRGGLTSLASRHLIQTGDVTVFTLAVCLFVSSRCIGRGWGST